MMTTDWHTAVEERVFRALNADLGQFVDRLAVILSAKGFGVLFGICLALLVVLARRAAGIRLAAALRPGPRRD